MKNAKKKIINVVLILSLLFYFGTFDNTFTRTMEAKAASKYSVKTKDGTKITAKKGETVVHAYQSYPGKSRSGIKIYLPNFESYTSGEFVVFEDEEYQKEWSLGYIDKIYNSSYVPVPCYHMEYIMPFGYDTTYLEEYIKVLSGLGFKVSDESYGSLLRKYYLRYTGTESITGDICGQSKSRNNYETYDMYISISLSNNMTLVNFEYPMEVGFETNSVKSITHDTTVSTKYYAANNRTFHVFGGNMTVGEYIILEVNKSKLKKGAVFNYSKLAEESDKANGICKLILMNTRRVGDLTDLYPSSAKVKNAKIKVLAADNNGVALYYYIKFTGRASHTFVFEGIAYSKSGSTSGTTVPSKIELDICNYCYGAKTCPVCYGRKGMRYNTWGQGGSGWVDCAGCKGSGKCSRCGGDGKKH